MKKVLTIFLALCMVVSLSGAVMAETPESGSSTITYSVDQTSWEIIVTPTIDIQKKETGSVAVIGYWAPYKNLSVTANDTVMMQNKVSKDTFNATVDFTNISKPGEDYTGSLPASAQESFTVDPDGEMNTVIRFGEWVGILTFTVELVDNSAYQGGEQDSLTPPIIVESAADLRKALTENTDAGSGSNVISISNDLDFSTLSEPWSPVKVDGYNGAGVITIRGNGHTFTNLTAPLLSGGFAGDSGIVIQDLTIANSTMTSTNTLGSGAFIESIDSMPIITLTNCTLMNSTVNGSRTGGLIGWTAGYNNVNNGPVKTYITIEKCSVVNCTINGSTESVGAINGHAGNNAWTYTTIKDCTIKDNTLIGGAGKTGVILGTANVGEVTISGCTVSGNTINGTASDAVYGRFVPDTTGKLTIDGVAIE